MKAVYGIILLVLSATLVFGSSGNFREFDGERKALYQVVDSSSSYIAFSCPSDGSSHGCDGGVEMTLTNNLDRLVKVYVYSDSNLVEFGNPTLLYPGETATISGTVSEHHGNFTANLQIVATWSGGSAMINACTLTISGHESAHGGCCENDGSGEE